MADSSHSAPRTLTWQIGSGGRFEVVVTPFPHGEIGFDLACPSILDTLSEDDESGAGRFCSNLTVAAARDLIGRLTRAVEHLERQGKA